MIAGSTVAIVASLIAFAGAPFYKSWMVREARISAAADELARLRSQIAAQDALLKTVNTLERTSGTQRKILSARTPSLAASELQRVMRIVAERSQISIDRLEFSSADAPVEGITLSIPFTIAAVGDIYGVTDFLGMLRSESPVVEVREISLVSNSALKAGLIQLSVSVQAPVLIQ